MVKRPLKFKLDAYRMYAQEKMTPLDAFAQAGTMNNVPLSGCMTTRAYASGYMSDDIKNVLRRHIANNNQEVLTYFEQWELDTKF